MALDTPLPPLKFRRDVTADFGPDDVDGNFENLDRRLAGLEANGVAVRDYVDTVQSEDGRDFSIRMTGGLTLGPVVLPPAPFEPQVDWIPLHPYRERDFVAFDGGSYLCLVDHESTEDFEHDLAGLRWMTVASRGSDAYVFRGDWQAGGWTAPMQGVVDPVPYRARDGVLHGGILWTTPTDPAPDGSAPGTAGTPWLALAVPASSLPATSVAETLRFRSVGPWPRGTVLGEAVIGRPQTLAKMMAGGLIKAISTQPSFQGGPPGATFGNNGSVTLVRNYTTLVARWVFQAGSNALTMFAWPPADLALEPGDNLRLVVDYDPINGTPTNAFWNDGVTILAALALYETPGA